MEKLIEKLGHLEFDGEDAVRGFIIFA